MKMLKLVLASFIAMSFLSTAALADAVKGQKLYLKSMKQHTNITGAQFAASNTQAGWKKLFEGDGAAFISEMSGKYPGLKDFLNSDNFKQKVMPDLKDFLIEFASDSGNVPSC